MLSFFICGIEVSLLTLGAEALLENTKGEYLVVL